MEEEYLRGVFLRPPCSPPPYSEPCSDSAAHVPSNGGGKERHTVSNVAESECCYLSGPCARRHVLTNGASWSRLSDWLWYLNNHPTQIVNYSSDVFFPWGGLAQLICRRWMCSYCAYVESAFQYLILVLGRSICSSRLLTCDHSIEQNLSLLTSFVEVVTEVWWARLDEI